MKKILIILLILISIPFYGQWVQQSSTVTTYLRDVYCITEDIVIVVGEDGTILKTTDGGTNWIQKISGTKQDLSKVQFVNSNIGYIIGGGGTLLKTIDGGDNWFAIITGINAFLSGLSCVNENVFFISQNGGVIRKTTNGGDSFEILDDPLTTSTVAIQFLNETTGYIISYYNLYKTTDGGDSWFLKYENIGSFYFLDEDIGFINAADGFSKTIDGGSNYIYLASVPFVMNKLFAPTENLVWGVTFDFLLNGEPNYTMRFEIDSLGEFDMDVSESPLFNSIHFANPTKGYGVIDQFIYKNSTGLLGVDQLETKDNINIYPNPATNQISISLISNALKSFNIQISDSLGKEIYFKSYHSENKVLINTSSFAKGIYFLNISNNEKRQIRKLIID